MKKDLTGAAFEREIQELLRLRGFEVTRDIRVNGFRGDMIARRGQEPFREVFLVEAKDHSRPIGSEAILKLAGAVQGFRPRFPGIVGLLISRHGFTADAKGYAQANGAVKIVTFSQLLDSLIDFSAYLRNYHASHTAKPSSKLFVDPSFSLEDSESGVQDSKLLDHMMQWVQDPHSPRNLVLLGEYGSGKTVFVEQLAYSLAQEILSGADPSLPVPMIIYLKEFARELHGVPTLILSRLVNQLEVDGNFPLFLNLLRRGRIILFLDGFDEMAMAVDEQTRDSNFLILQSLCGGGGRVVITGRPEYFPSDRHLTDLISDQRYLNPAAQAVLREMPDLPKFLRIHIHPFDTRQIRAFLDLCENYYDKEVFPGANSVARKIKETYDLENLASRPVLLDLIVKTLPRLSTEKIVSAGRLYGLYTSFWIKREESKGRRLIPNEVKQAFVHELSWTMLMQGILSIHYSKVPLEAIDFFEPETDGQLEAYAHDIRTCSYLSRDSSGNYFFSHKTFMEFFCASRIKRELEEGVSNPFAELNLPTEIVGFFADIANEATLEALIDMIYTYSQVTLFRSNLLRYLARIPLPQSVGAYLQCIAHFPNEESRSLDRQMRRRLERLDLSERWQVAASLSELYEAMLDNKSSKALARFRVLIDSHSLIVDAFSRQLSGRPSDSEADSSSMSLFRSDFEILQSVANAVQSVCGFRRLGEVVKKSEDSFTSRQIRSFADSANASLRLLRELAKKFRIPIDEASEVLRSLRLKKISKTKANTVLKRREVEVFQEELGLSSASAREVLRKSALPRDEIRRAFRQIGASQKPDLLSLIEQESGLGPRVFQSYLPLCISAARKAGIL